MPKIRMLLLVLSLAASATVSVAVEYRFRTGDSVGYDLSYGDHVSRVLCRLDISCTNLQKKALSVSNTVDTYDLRLVYSDLKMGQVSSDESGLKVTAENDAALKGLAPMVFSATIDKEGNVISTDMRQVVAKAGGTRDSQDHAPIITSAIFPLIAGTWKAVLPKVAGGTDGTLPQHDKRDWSVVGEGTLRNYLQSGETGLQKQIDRDKSGNVVLWQKFRNVSRTYEFADAMVYSEVTIESRYDRERRVVKKGLVETKHVTETKASGSDKTHTKTLTASFIATLLADAGEKVSLSTPKGKEEAPDKKVQ